MLLFISFVLFCLTSFHLTALFDVLNPCFCTINALFFQNLSFFISSQLFLILSLITVKLLSYWTIVLCCRSDGLFKPIKQSTIKKRTLSCLFGIKGRGMKKLKCPELCLQSIFNGSNSGFL